MYFMRANEQQFLYLTTIGCKTGKHHEIEIWFVEEKGLYYIASELGHRSNWVRNIKDNNKVSFRDGKKTIKGTARVIDRNKEPELIAKFSALMHAKYHWSEGLIVVLKPSSS